MLFNKKDKTASFRPAQLTPENFDAFAKKYSLPKSQYNSDIPYTTLTR